MNYDNRNGMEYVGLTMDVDWAPDFVLEKIFDEIRERKLNCTVFATHESEVIKNIDRKYFEVAIHPFFKDENYREPIRKLLGIYKEARGLRSHCLIQSSNIIAVLPSEGIRYDSNTYLANVPDITAFKDWNGLVRIPFFFMDTFFLDTHSKDSRKIENICLDRPGLKIFDFHPIHLYLNTETVAQYNKMKTECKLSPNTKKDVLDRYINKERDGTKDILSKLLLYIDDNKLKTFKMNEVEREIGSKI